MTERRLFTVEETGHYMGVKPKTIYNQLSLRKFPIKPVRVGGRVLLDIRAIDHWIEREQKKK